MNTNTVNNQPGGNPYPKRVSVRGEFPPGMISPAGFYRMHFPAMALKTTLSVPRGEVPFRGVGESDSRPEFLQEPPGESPV